MIGPGGRSAPGELDRMTEMPTLPRTTIGVSIVFAGLGTLFLLLDEHSFPSVHTILDTCVALLSGVLALLFWEMGLRVNSPLPKWLAISFTAAFLLDFLHVLAIVDWSGPLSFLVPLRGYTRPLTWAPASHVIPIGIIVIAWMLRRKSTGVRGFAMFMAVVVVALVVIFRQLPNYVPPTVFDMTRPALVFAPILWGGACVLCWRLRRIDRVFMPLVLASAMIAIGHIMMLYSQAPHDNQAMVAHMGKVSGRLIILLSLMQMATHDMMERFRAEAKLARLNEGLEQRITKRTEQLAASNAALQSEIAVRRAAEQKTHAQIGRLSLLHQITRAVGERQDLDSIFQVVARSVEDELPADFACVCLYDNADHVLTVVCVGAKGGPELAKLERAQIDIDENGLLRCLKGELVYEPDIATLTFGFPRQLAAGGLRSLVLAPLQVEAQVFGLLVTGRTQPEGFSSGDCEFLRKLSDHTALASHQAQLYGALHQAYEDLRQTQQAVMQQERLRALGQMASGIAHDINNALSPVSLYTQSLLDMEPDLSARARECLETILRAVEDVAHTVGRMREFYRQREPQLLLAPVQMNDIIRHVVDLTRARWSDMAQQRGTVISVKTELADGLPVVAGVESELREALINLIFNAVDAMPDGGTLTIRTKALGRSEGGAPDQVVVEVADDGVGMNEETRRRCLEPFFTTKGERGTGLGLAMVYGVVQRHNADIDIRSVIGAGTTVALTFAVPAEAPSEQAAASGQKLLPRLRLLLIDDDPVLLKSLRSALETEGHITIAANDGATGIAMFKEAIGRSETIHAVITDLGMPRVDGRQVASAIKEALSTMPVIMLTGWGQRLSIEGDIPPHVDHVLSKPPKLRELREALAHCYELGAKARAGKALQS